jgi:hypothetical protein
MTKILVLKSEEGIIITKKDLEEIYYRFYKLYKAHRELLNLTKLKINVCNTLPKKFIEVMIPKLKMPIITRSCKLLQMPWPKGNLMAQIEW